MASKLFYSCTLKAQESDNGDVVIEGWANKPVVDDVGDKMAFDKVDLNRFKRNPIMFFNHDRNMPIGKWLEWKVSEQGLWVKGTISKSKDAAISYIRDMVKEGILKTLSIGFEPKDMNFDRQNQVNNITDWRLNEVSVVTMPCNVEAEFALSKSLEEAKSYSEARELILKALEDKKPEGEPETEVPPGTEPEDEKPDEEKLKNAFQDCVSSKIPKLIEEGKTQEEAVAMAMAMCRDEGKCSIDLAYSSEMLAFAKEVASKKPEEQTTPKEKAEPEVLPPAVPISQPSDDPSNFGSPHLDLAKAQLALLGKISEQIAATNVLLTQLLEKETEMGDDSGNVPSQPATPPQGDAGLPAKDLEKIAAIKDKIAATIKELGL